MNKEILLSFGLIGSLATVSCNNDITFNEQKKMETQYEYSEDNKIINLVINSVTKLIIDKYENKEESYFYCEVYIYDKAIEFYGEENWDDSLDSWFSNLNLESIDDLKRFFQSETWLAYFILNKEEFAEQAWLAQYM